MDAIYGSNAVPMAISWVSRECSAHHPEVRRMCVGPWSDAIASLGLCLEQPVFRQRLRHALGYCSDCRRIRFGKGGGTRCPFWASAVMCVAT